MHKQNQIFIIHNDKLREILILHNPFCIFIRFIENIDTTNVYICCKK